MKDGFLSKVNDFRDIHGSLRTAFDASLDFLNVRHTCSVAFREGAVELTHFELVHYGTNLRLERFIGNLSTTEVNFVSDQDYWDLMT